MDKKPIKLISDVAHATGGAIENKLEHAIGREVRTFRKSLGMTGTELARAADLSLGMLSKIENGQTSPSLSTLESLSVALNVPVTAFFAAMKNNAMRPS